MDKDLKHYYTLTGELFFRTFSRLIQTVKIHRSNNSLLIDCVTDFVHAVTQSCLEDEHLKIQILHGRFYLQGMALVHRSDNLPLIQHMLYYFNHRALQGLCFNASISGATSEQIISFAHLLNSAEHMETPLVWLQSQLMKANYPWVEIIIEADSMANTPGKRVEVRIAYSNAMTSIKEVAKKLTSQKRAGVLKTKHLIQNMVEMIIEDDAYLLGMSTIRDYDDYTYTHSVNVAILSMCLGNRLGLSRIALERLGLCGMLHDLGKVEINHELITKATKLTDEEYVQIKAHSLNSVRQIVKLNVSRDLKAKILLPPFEHHLRYDLTGYPQTDRKEPLSLFGRILTISDVFDAMTSPRVYRPVALSPDRVLNTMWSEAGTVFDPLLMKVFINMIGVYPVGTLLLLDTGEMCLVAETNENTEIGRPLVVLIHPVAKGEFQKGEFVDLSERDMKSGNFLRTIANSFNPSVYGIQPSDFLV